MSTATFILASASPRRKQLLEQIGARFIIQPADIDETPHKGEAPGDYVRRLAVSKAKAIQAGMPVLGSDTVVAVDGRLMGKPASPEEAIEMLSVLSGRIHSVQTGVALVSPAFEESFVTETKVEFLSLSEDEIRSYVGTGEPFDKSGAYAIQGIASAFVSSLNGSFSSVVGLPISETAQLLKKYGLWSLPR
jgi:septum formation protein